MKRIRKSFGKIRKIVEIPDLIGMQRDSYHRFLQSETPPEKREDIGLQSVFRSVFPIKDFSGSASLEFVSYKFGPVKHGVEECIHRGMTYEVPVKITVRLVVYDVDKETGTSNIRDIKEQEIYFGAIPLMTDKGTFIINGTERVVVSQLHRSSGVFFNHDKGKTHSSGKVIYTSRIIPVRGSWIDMEVDPKDIVHIKIDKRRKFPVTLLFKACGYSSEDILSYFYKTQTVRVCVPENYENKPEDTLSSDQTALPRFFLEFGEIFQKGQRAGRDVTDPLTHEIVVKKGRIFTRRALRQLKASGVRMIPADTEDILGKITALGVPRPGEDSFLAGPNELIDSPLLSEMVRAARALPVTETDHGRAHVLEFRVIFTGQVSGGDAVHKTLLLDKAETKEEALLDIYRRLRPGNPATPEVAQDFIDQLFFKSAYYDLSGVGRMKINLRLGIDTPVHVRTLRKEDILLTAKTLIELRDSQGIVDDIDHLGNRRVRAVGELLENQYRIGLVRMERAIKERMSLQEVDALMPNDLVNPKPVSAVLKEFFGTSQLSQFMDQTNPLSETTHKRRLSALGPGGLTRERAGFEVRDVHPSHYGRICPIETPEGPNIGLIVSLSTYARVNDYGFIETPYSVVKDAEVTEHVRFLSAFEEKDHPIAQANAPLESIASGTEKKNQDSASGTPVRFRNLLVTSRVIGEFMMVPRERIELMDISPNQLVSVSASLIPFLENDDANRALMGSNMQRQAVPLVAPDAPVVGTGIEGVVARDSGVTVVAPRDAVVADVEASRIVLKIKDPEFGNSDEREAKDIPGQRQGPSAVKIFNLSKFVRSNQNTCFNHRPIVVKGQHVRAGEVIADGPATDSGELALGKNVTVAFMPWGGYNFEDSILISENLVKEGVYTSVHIEEFEVVARDTKLGKEEITRDIPNVGDEALRDLDESGIIRLGAEVAAGSVLVGKVTPKGETQLSPEEKLLRAIFGEKAGDVKDTSLRIPPGVEGIVIDAKVFSRRGVDKDDRTRSIEDDEIALLEKNRDDELSVLREVIREHIRRLLSGSEDLFLKKPFSYTSVGTGEKKLLNKGVLLTPEMSDDIPVRQADRLLLTNAAVTEKIQRLAVICKKEVRRCGAEFEKKAGRYEKGDDLPPGVNKMVKVYVAMKRKLSVGDKMAGRHGNKGVVSCILHQEDMPFFEDGTPVDMVLNPLGVPSRMNVGQILEIHLGRAAKGLGDQLNHLAEKNRFDAFRKKMREIFKNQLSSEEDNALENASDRELRKLASQYKRGVNMATPVFDGAKEEEIKAILKQGGLSESAQTVLYDGRTGEAFREKITVGTMYMLKLHHLVDDKIHARSIGPYSLVTQQPLGGKAQFGGQRLGEMEVWAMEAYGSAYSLQEFLTVKSDDMAGRTRMYEKIVKGQNVLEPGIPESFNVLTKELQSLGLEVNLLEKED
ncbi:DNA-directed RNA polymerase subunit beta [Desulfonema magnum]|nr:DNA-directed RNA polymerase subunit beta [Desulfonema magnum]